MINSNKVNYSNGNATARKGWTSVQIKSNQASPHNGLAGSYVDIDDVVIRSSGYIGPIVRISAPSGVKIID